MLGIPSCCRLESFTFLSCHSHISLELYLCITSFLLLSGILHLMYSVLFTCYIALLWKVQALHCTSFSFSASMSCQHQNFCVISVCREKTLMLLLSCMSVAWRNCEYESICMLQPLARIPCNWVTTQHCNEFVFMRTVHVNFRVAQQLIGKLFVIPFSGRPVMLHWQILYTCWNHLKVDPSSIFRLSHLCSLFWMVH